MSTKFNIHDIPAVHTYDQRRVETRIKFNYLKKHYPEYLFDAKGLFQKHLPEILQGKLSSQDRELLARHGYNPNLFTRIIKAKTEVTILDLHLFASMLDCTIEINFLPNQQNSINDISNPTPTVQIDETIIEPDAIGNSEFLAPGNDTQGRTRGQRKYTYKRRT